MATRTQKIVYTLLSMHDSAPWGSVFPIPHHHFIQCFSISKIFKFRGCNQVVPLDRWYNLDCFSLDFHYAYFVAFFLLFLRLHVRMTCASFFYPLPTLSPTCDSRFFRLIRSNNSSGSFRRSPLGHRRGLFTRLTFSIYLNLARAIARS